MDDTAAAPTSRMNIYHRLATFCLLAPFIGVAINFLLLAENPEHLPQTREQALACAFLIGAAPVLGVFAGAISLLGIRKHGSASILWKTMTGLAIFALMVLAVVPPLLKTIKAAREQHEQRYGHPPP
jgi:hypothetical protein